LAVLGEILYKLGQVDTTIGDRKNDVSAEKLGVIEWACALKIFDESQRASQALAVIRSLQERMQKYGTPAFRRMITAVSQSEKNICQYDVDQTVRRLEAQR
jgi:hypothetical protein